MRHVIIGLAVMVGLLVSPLFGADDAQAIRKELNDLQQQLMKAQREAGQTEAIKPLQQKVMDAQKALQTAIAAIPAIKTIDDKLAELRKQQGDLMKERDAEIKKNDEALKEPKKAVTDANDAVKAALAEVPAVKELLTKQTELQNKLKELAPARKPGEQGPKKPEAKKPEAK